MSGRLSGATGLRPGKNICVHSIVRIKPIPTLTPIPGKGATKHGNPPLSMGDFRINSPEFLEGTTGDELLSIYLYLSLLNSDIFISRG